MTDDRARTVCDTLTRALARAFDHPDLDPHGLPLDAPPIEWRDFKNVRIRRAAEKGGEFLDFGMGGGRPDRPLAIDARGPLRAGREPGHDALPDAIGYFKLRARVDARGPMARLEIHTMVVDWHLGRRADPARREPRIELARRLERLAVPAGWLPGPYRLSEQVRSAMSWRWGTAENTQGWRNAADPDALAAQVAEQVRTLRSAIERLRA